MPHASGTSRERPPAYACLLVLSVVAAAAAGCSRAPSGPRFPGAPLVLISIDTLRADRLPAWGYGRVETPHIDRLRKDSILFENAYSHVPLTLPAHASLLTGLLPFEHGIRDNLGYRLDGKRPGLASLLKQEGYATAAAVSAYVLRSASGLGEGFDSYEDHMVAPAGTDALGRVQRGGGETFALVKPWITSVKDRPFFLFFHTYEPHAPYEPPEPYRSRFPDAYDGEVAAADAVVGELLEELRRLGVYDRALVVLVSDHGEGLGEHGEDDHGILLYRWALHVPLLVKLPRRERAGTTVKTPVELVDMLPTLAAALDFEAPKGLRGRSLLGPGLEARKVYAETYYPRIHLGWSELRSVIDERWQYIEGRHRELYDLAADPRQLANVFAANGDVGRSLQKHLAGHPAGLEAPREVGSEERERLAALGYLGGAVEATGPLPDPRESIAVLKDVKAAFRLGAAGRDEEAVAVFRQVLARYPALFDARFEMAQTLVRLQRWDEAYDAFRAALRTAPSLAGPIALALSRVCVKLGRLDEAEANAKIALGQSPAQAHEQLARVALARDDLDGAEREAALVRGDLSAELGAAVVRAEVRIRRDQPVEALAVADQAKRLVRERGVEAVPDLDFLRGDALARLGRNAEAAAAFEEEIRRFPRNAQAYTRLAIVYGIQRRTFGDVDRLLEAMVAASDTPETMELAAKTLDTMGDAAGARTWRKRAAAAGGPRAR